MAADRCRMLCTIDRIPADRRIKNCVMEMWKTAAYADGKPIHSLWKRTGPFPQPANRFPTATPDQAVYAHSHNACYGDYSSDPFLSFMERKRKENKKRMGVQPIGRTEKLYSRFTL